MKFARPGQKLKEHLIGVGEKTANRMPEKWRSIGYYAGLWHDLGKILQAWQDYLHGKRPRLPHSPHGAMLARSYSKRPTRAYLPSLTFVIYGHHGGLKNKKDLGDELLKDKAQNWEKAKNEAAKEIENFLPSQLPEFELRGTRLEFAIRMLFGCLVDADRIDAAIATENASPDIDEASVIPKLSICFNPRPVKGALAELRSKLRREFASDCKVKATSRRGLYRLTGSTGVGKTIASLQFAIEHCKTNSELTGILYVGPLQSIIDQNWREYEKVLKIPVLAHYSDFQPKANDLPSYKLTTERWDAAVICTSGIQFYESLFARHPAKCRKLSHLMNRCILIDEAQTIPLKYAKPILDVLTALVEDWGCTVVLMSATQPSFQNVDSSFDEKCIDLIDRDRSEYLFKEARLVNYQISSESWNWEQIAQRISNSRQSLTIVNTTKLAREGFQALSNLVDGDWFHLSARMIPAHRRQIIDAIKQRLDNKRSCHVISTQIVEAGVNLDFPLVLRQFAPLDSIIQAAGRCNREGKIENWQEAIVQVFEVGNPKDPSNYPSTDYTSRTQHTRDILNSPKYDLNENLLEAIELYYSRCYSSLTGDELNIQKLRHNLQFEEVDNLFKLIEDSKQFSAFVPWDEGAKLAQTLDFSQTLLEDDWRKLQPYTVNLPDSLRSFAEETPSGVMVWSIDLYDNNFGVIK